MMIFNLFNIAILTLGNQVFATPLPVNNTLHARSPPPPPPPPPPIPPAPPATTANKSTVEIHPRIAPQVGPIPKIHLVPRHQLDNFAGKPVPPHRPHQRRDLPGIGQVVAYPFGKLPDFVKDDRYEWNNIQYPAYAFGGVLLGAKSYANAQPRTCSGSLVGPRHVLIARHCFGDKLADSISFESNFFEGRSGGKSYATDVITLDGLECQKTPKDGEEKFNCALLNDWAILILADRMGETHGYLGVKEFDTKILMMNKQPFSHVGFPNKFLYDKGKPLRQDGITVEKCYTSCDIPGDRLLTDADCQYGASGGPLFRMEDGLAWQYGVASSRFWDLTESQTPPDRCAFVSSTKFITAVAMARQQFP